MPAMTVTATAGGVTANGISISSVVLAGALLGPGNTGTQTGAAAHEASFTTTVSKSRFYLAAVDFANTSFTVDAQTHAISNLADAVNGRRYAAGQQSVITGTPGAITLGYTAPTDNGGLAGVEVLTAIPGVNPVDTLTEFAGVVATGASTVTSASFSPPPGTLLIVMVAANGGAGVVTMSVTDSYGLQWSEAIASNASGAGYAGVWLAWAPPGGYSSEPSLAPGWQPGLPGEPDGVPFYAPPQAWTAPAPPPPVIPAGTVTFSAPLPRTPAHRARLGARGAVAAGILATGIGPPPVAAPHQPPVIAHPAPHRAQWRAGQGAPPNAAQQVKRPVPVTVYVRVPHRAQWRAGSGQPPNAAQQVKIPGTVFTRRPHAALWRGGQGQPPNAAQQVKIPATVFVRKPHAAQWRGGRGQVPAALPQPFRPPSFAPRPAHRAQWRGGAGPAVASTLGSGLPQPFTPKTVYSRKPHPAQWHGGAGVPPAAQPQPFRPKTVYARAAHRVLWRSAAGQPPPVVPSLGAPQPFTPKTVYQRAAHRALWRAVTGRPPAAAAQPFRPATVYRRTPHGALWRAVTGKPPAATAQPFRPPTVFRRFLHRLLWRAGLGSPAPPPPAFTVGQLAASTAPDATLTASGAPAGTLTTQTGSGTLTAATSAAGAAEYGGVYGPDYGPQEGTLTAGDQRTGGPG